MLPLVKTNAYCGGYYNSWLSSSIVSTERSAWDTDDSFSFTVNRCAEWRPAGGSRPASAGGSAPHPSARSFISAFVLRHITIDVAQSLVRYPMAEWHVLFFLPCHHLITPVKIWAWPRCFSHTGLLCITPGFTLAKVWTINNAPPPPQCKVMTELEQDIVISSCEYGSAPLMSDTAGTFLALSCSFCYPDRSPCYRC